VAKKDATLLTEKSSDHSVVMIRLVGHLDMMPESPARTVCATPTLARYLRKVNLWRLVRHRAERSGGPSGRLNPCRPAN
jgi:hypothetical protein